MKKMGLSILILMFFCFVSVNASPDEDLKILKEESAKATPEGFKMDESGVDKNNSFAVYKKTSQEIITFNLQKDHMDEYEDVDVFTINERKMIFSYMGMKKNARLIIFLKNDAGYLIVGYNKPYMGDEIVKKEELMDMVKKIDLREFE